MQKITFSPRLKKSVLPVILLIGTLSLAAVAFPGPIRDAIKFQFENVLFSAQASGSGFDARSSAPLSSNVPIIVTDKTGYLAGDAIEITAAGYLPGEALAITLSRSSGEILQTWNTVADENGNAAASWTIALADTGGNDFRVTATGASGAVETAFSRIAVINPNKFKFEPGEEVVIEGRGFRPGENVLIEIGRANLDDSGTPKTPFNVTADNLGNVSVQWTVDPNDTDGAIFRITARGGSSTLEGDARLDTASTFLENPILDSLTGATQILDDEGPDDEPGQKDLNSLSIDETEVTTFAVAWNWDDIRWTGNNSGDGCALIDTDADGNANYAFCATVKGDPAVQTNSQLYVCNDTRADRCQGNPAPSGYLSNSLSGVVPNSDPFASDPTHTDSKCNGTNCNNNDTVTNATIYVSDLGGVTDPRIVNVCSYPSAQPNSDPSDCVFNPENGFLVIEKVATPDDDTNFVFNANRSAQTGLSQWTINGSGSTDPISYSPTLNVNLSEVVPAGWQLDSASCSINTATPTATGTKIGNSVTEIDIRPGLTTTCTFTNSLQTGTITIIKDAQPNHPQDFGFTSDIPENTSFSLDDDSDPALLNTKTINNVLAGNYTVIEGAETGWSLTAINCTSSGGLENNAINPQTRTAGIVLEPAEHVTCTFVNAKRTSLTLVKEVVNDDGGTADAGDWTLTATDQLNQPVLSGAGGATGYVPSGTLTLGESGGPSGYTASQYSCVINGAAAVLGNTVTLGGGDEATCTITNDDLPGTLIVNKVIVNDDGGTRTASDFSFSVNSGQAVPFEADGSNSITVNAGSYSVVETNPGDYAVSYDNCTNVNIPNGGTATCTITNDDPEPDLSITKTAGAATVSAGDNISFTITVANGGPGIAQNVTVTDTLPTNTGLNWSINPATPGCSITGGVLTCSFGEMAANTTKTVTIFSPTSYATCATVNNTASYNSTNGGTNQASASVTVQCPDISIAKIADSVTVNAGDQIGFTIQVTNSGPGIARNVTVSDILPAGLTWTINPAVQGCTIVAGVLSCSFGDLAAGTSASVHISAPTSPTNCGTINNTAAVSLANGPTEESTASAVVNCPDISVIKTAGAESVTAGSPISFTITVSNAGPGTAYGVMLSDTLPTGSDISWSIGPGGDGAACGIAAGVLTCNFGSIAAGGSKTVTVSSQTTADSCGAYNNTATATPTNGSAATSNTASTFVACPDIDLVKDGVLDLGDNGYAEPEDVINYTLTATNTGNVPLTGVYINDPLEGLSPLACKIGEDVVVNGEITLAVGQSVTCTASYPITEDDMINGEVLNSAVACNDEEVCDGTVTECPEGVVCDDGDDETPIPGKLIVRKTVILDNGGDKGAADFFFRVNDGDPIQFIEPNVGDGLSGENVIPFLVGDDQPYAVTEDLVTGYTPTIGEGCTGTISNGETKICEITNDDQPGTLIVQKNLITNSGGTETVSDFSFKVNGGAPVAFEPDGSNSLTVNAGEYTVVEPAVSGYTTTYQNCSNVFIPNGGTATCIITNDDQQAYITVNKVVNGGSAQPDDFNLKLNGNAVSHGVQVPVNPGNYAASETLLPSYSFVGFSGDCAPSGQITIALGESKTCTLTNRYNPPLTVTKTANTTFTRTYGWAITKTVDSPILDLFQGDTGTANYTIELTKTGYTDTAWAVSGSITVNNPAQAAANILSVTDAISGVGPVVANCGVSFPYSLPPGQTLNCTYSSLLPDGTNRTNTATVTTDGTEVLGNSGTADVTFGSPTTEVNATVNVTDSLQGTLGSFSNSTQIEYAANYPCGSTRTIGNTATIVETNQNSSASVQVNCYGLTVSKTAVPAYTRTHSWTIQKSVNDEAVDLFTGDTVNADYAVFVDKTTTDSGFTVAGQITINNPAPMPASLSSVIDSLPGGFNVAVTCPANVVQANGSLVCTYTAAVPDTTSRTNTATATLSNGTAFTGTQNVVFGEPTTVVGSSTVDVSDDLAGPLGSASADTTFEYSLPLTCAEGDQTVTNTATIVQTGQNDSASVAINCHELTVTKTAQTSLTRTWDWTINKTADQTDLLLEVDQSFLVNYTVGLNASSTDSEWAVGGSIAVSNPAPIPATINNVTDVVSGPVNASVSCGVNFPYVLVGGGTLNCTYTAALTNADSRTNTATATLQNTPSGTTNFTGSANVSFANATLTEVDESVNVTDSMQGSLGSVTADQVPETFTYSRNVGPYSQCGEYTVPNTASFVTNDIGATGSDSHNVDVSIPCGTIVIRKETLPDNSPQSFIFDPSWSGLNFQLTDGGSETRANLNPGSYTVQELATEGWQLTNVTCTDPSVDSTANVPARTASINVAGGETVTCTFFNSKLPKLTVIKNVITPENEILPDDFLMQINSGGGVVSSFPGSSTGTTYTFATPTASYNVTEVMPTNTGPYQDTYSTDCSGSLNPGDEKTCTVTNTYRSGWVTSSSLCEFDVDENRDGNQFRLVFTPDNSTSIHKLNASNPGQYYYNVLHYNDPEVTGDESLTMTIPFPFVTHGATPVHVYTSFTTTGSGGSLCMLPGEAVANQQSLIFLSGFDPQDFSATQQVLVEDLPEGTSYVNIHLDYGLKRTTGYTKGGSGNDAINSLSGVNIIDFQNYVFSNGVGPNWIVESTNTFKRNPGGGGNVSNNLENPIPGEQFQMFNSRGQMVGSTATSDEDGWYFINYKHTGKAANYNVKWLRTGQMKTITLRANGTAEANFP